MDALVIFGATGDLAKLETFPALVGLVDRGRPGRPRGRGRQERVGPGPVPRRTPRRPCANNGMDPDAARRREDARAAALRRRRPRRRRHLRRDVAARWATGGRALFYLEVPPFLFGRIARGHLGGRPRRGRPGDGGEAVRQRPATAPRRSTTTMHAVLPRGRGLPRRPLAGAGPARERARRPLRQLDARAAAQPRPTSQSVQITMAEAFDVADRGRFYDRDRRHPRRRAEPHAPGAGHRARRPAGRVGAATRWLDAKARVVAALRPLDPAGHGLRPVRGLPRRRRGRTRARRRRRTSRCGWRLDTWRWAGVPILIRAGKTMPVTATEITHPVPAACRSTSSASAPSGSATRCASGSGRRAEIGLTPGREEAGRRAWAELQELVFAEHGGSDMRPYDRLIGAALDGDGCCSPGRTPSRRPGGSSTRSSGDAVPVHPYPRGSWGPKEADALLPNGDTWHDPAG